jgi:hypothetical protein
LQIRREGKKGAGLILDLNSLLASGKDDTISIDEGKQQINGGGDRLMHYS